MDLGVHEIVPSGTINPSDIKDSGEKINMKDKFMAN